MHIHTDPHRTLSHTVVLGRDKARWSHLPLCARRRKETPSHECSKSDAAMRCGDSKIWRETSPRTRNPRHAMPISAFLCVVSGGKGGCACVVRGGEGKSMIFCGCAFVFLFVDVCTCVCVRVCVCEYVILYVHVCAYVNVYVYVHIYEYILCMCTCACAFVNVCVRCVYFDQG